eukprot:TRINITY_DN14058_c0_g1_i1.p1 TRINITY_DN14058_c0_g1~~TRINITY_DN14058_c0_g1_i1.p1  ORF type:complete len:417 (+),score=121.69 TRINITY_DN14058_c0_g1_i1:180-1430(+)
MEEDLALLRQLGFRDDAQNTKVLADAGGDLRAALAQLLPHRAEAGASAESGLLSTGAAALWGAAALVGGVLGAAEPQSEAPLDPDDNEPEPPQDPKKVEAHGNMANSSVCAECKTNRFFAPFNPGASWYGLAAPTEWGLTRRHHCRACWRSVCAECSPNMLPLKVCNMPERVCNRCWKSLRPAALSVADSQRVQATRKQAEDTVSQLIAEKDSLVREQQEAAALVQSAQAAAKSLKVRESQFEADQAQASAELEALRDKAAHMASLLEQEQAAAEQVRTAMAALRDQLEVEEEEKQGNVDKLQEIQSDRRAKEEALEEKETELRALRAEYEELESDMFTPTLVQLNKLQAEHTATVHALQELEQRHFNGEGGAAKGLGPAYATKGIGELDMGKMIEEWGMEAVSYTHLTLPTKRIV